MVYGATQSCPAMPAWPASQIKNSEGPRSGGPAGQERWPSKHNRKQKKLFRLRAVARLPGNMRLMVLQFFFCLKQFFGDQQYISLAMAASRIGCRNRLLGLIAKPGGYGAWLPPQAFPHPLPRNPNKRPL